MHILYNLVTYSGLGFTSSEQSVMISRTKHELLMLKQI